MATAKKTSLNSLSKNLNSVESQIASICLAKGVCPDDLEQHLDKFSVDEEDRILELLKEKLVLQETIFNKQGGSLDNVVFLASHQ